MKKLLKALSLVLCLLMVLGTVPFAVFAEGEEEYTELYLNQPFSVSGEQYFTYTPETTGVYTFYSKGDVDTLGYLYDSEMNELVSNDDFDDHNFSFSCQLTAGETYYFSSAPNKLTIKTEYYVYLEFPEDLNQPEEPKIESIEISCEETEFNINQYYIFNLTQLPEEVEADDITWTVSDDTAAEIYWSGNSQCEVYIKADKSFTLKAQCENCDVYDTYEVSVEEIPEITVGEENTVTVSEDGEYLYKFTPAETDYYKYRVGYSSGNTYFNGRIYDSDFEYVSPSYGGGFTDIRKFEAGKTYYLELDVTLYSDEAGIEIQIEKSVGVTAIKVISGPVNDYVSDCGGPGYDGLELEFTMSDGSTVNWKYNEDEYQYVNGLYPAIYERYNSTTEEYTDLLINMCGVEVTVSYNVIENPVKSIELSSGSIELLKESNGKYATDNSGNAMFYYYLPDDDIYNLEFTINYTDGSSVTVPYGEVNGYWISYSDDQYNKPWVVGSDNTVTFEYLDATVDVTVTITDGPISSIELVSDGGIELMENVGGYITSDEVTGENKFFYYNDYYNQLNDLKFKINYSDGSSETVSYGDYVLDNYSWDRNSNQYTYPWTKDGENYLTVSYGNKSCKVPVTVTENPIKSVELASDGVEIIEKADGYYSGDIYYYNYTRYMEDLEFKITYSDDSSATVKFGSEAVSGYTDWNYGTNQDESPWVRGGNNYIDISYLGHSVRVSVTLVDSPIKSMTLVSGGVTLAENTNGGYATDDDGNEYFLYYLDDLEGLQFEVTYQSGETVTVNYGDTLISGFGWEAYSEQGTQHWTKDGENYLYVKYLNSEVAVPVSITESPIRSLELVSGSIEYIENDNGYYTTDNSGNEMFYYHMDWTDLNNAQFKISFTDESRESKIVSYDSYIVDGLEWDYSSNQNEEPWVLGGSYHYTITYGNASVNIPVTIIKNPIASIELVSGSISLIENGNGYYDTDNNGNKMFYYNMNWTDLNNAQFRINYTDENKESEIVHYDDFVIDGGSWDYNSNQYEEPWVLGGSYYFEISYSGHTVNIPVTIVEHPIKSVELVSGSIKLIENTDGYYANDESYFHYYLNDLSDLIFKITYADGSTVSVNYGDYVMDGYGWSAYSDQSTEHWVVGGSYYAYIDYAGKTVNVPVTVEANPVKSIKLLSDGFEFIENGDGEYWTDDNGETHFEYYMYDDNLTVLEFEVTLTDGTVKTVNYGDTVIEDYEWEAYSSQYSQPWTKGGENYFTVEYLGATAQVPAIIIENPIKSIELVSGEIEFNENSNGYNATDEEGNKYFSYYMESDLLYDLQFKITYTDNTTETAGYGDSLKYGSSWDWNDNQYQNHWLPDSENYVTVYYMDVEANVPVTINKCPVKSIEWVSGAMELYENIGGYYNTDGYGEEYFIYDSNSSLYSVKFKVTYDDDSTEVVEYGDSIVSGFDWWWDSNQHEEHWTVGSDNCMTVYYGSANAQVPVTVLENPIESIEVSSGEIRIYENCNGYYTYNNGEEFYYYYIYDEWFDSIKFTVTYSNGTTETVSYEDEIIEDYYWNQSNNQYSEHWEKDKENYINVSYFGFEIPIPVIIEESPVDSIELVSGSVELTENGYGYYSTDDSGEEYFVYWLKEKDMLGLQLKLTYTDGTSETAYYGDNLFDGYNWDYDYDQEAAHWTVGSDNYLTVEYMGKTADVPVTVTENFVESIVINSAPTREYIYGDCTFGEFNSGEYYLYNLDYTGLSLTVNYENGDSKTFTADDIVKTNYGYELNGEYILFDRYAYIEGSGEYTVTINYLGASAAFEFTVLPSTVEKVEIVKSPDKTDFYYGFSPDFIGAQIKITYTNGSSETVNITEENIEYTGVSDYMTSIIAEVLVNGSVMHFGIDYYTDKYAVSFMGQTDTFDFEFTDGIEKITEIKEFDLSGKGIEVTFRDADGELDTIVLEPVYSDLSYSDPENEYYYYAAKTEYGIVCYNVDVYYSGEEIEKYYTYILRDGLELKHNRGDVSCDGNVNATDLTKLKKLLLKGTDDLTAEQKYNYDVNFDGAVDVRDIISLKKLLSGENTALKGDADNSGTLNASDLTYLKKSLLANEELSETELYIYDVNGDGLFDVRDVINLKRTLAA